MNGLHYTKSKRQIYIERIALCSTLTFLIGVLCGMGAYKATHKCNTPIFKTVEIKATPTPMPTPTATPTPIPTEKPTVKLKATKTPAPTIVVTPVPTQAIEENTAEENLRGLGTFKLTAYCNCSKCCGKYSGGPTASGTMPQAGRTIAVDTKVIPFGTKVIIDGHEYIAEDTGKAIKGNKIDIYFDSHTEASNFGVQHKEIFIG